jgi:hypothetical protein
MVYFVKRYCTQSDPGISKENNFPLSQVDVLKLFQQNTTIEGKQLFIKILFEK